MFYVRHLAKYSSELTGEIQRSRGVGGAVEFLHGTSECSFQGRWLAGFCVEAVHRLTGLLQAISLRSHFIQTHTRKEQSASKHLASPSNTAAPLPPHSTTVGLQAAIFLVLLTRLYSKIVLSSWAPPTIQTAAMTLPVFQAVLVTFLASERPDGSNSQGKGFISARGSRVSSPSWCARYGGRTSQEAERAECCCLV